MSDYRINEALFNSYVYNLALPFELKKEPLVGEEAFKKPEQSKKLQEFESENENENENLLLYYRYLMKISQTHIVEILFVLSTMLCGKRKNDFQVKLINTDFIHQLIELFKKIKWSKLPINIPIQNRSDVGLKIQLLRFVYNLNSKDEWDLDAKFNFITKDEIEILL